MCCHRQRCTSSYTHSSLWVSNQSTAPGVTAQEWDYADGQGRVGLISSVTQAFCGDCTRMRLSTDGKLYTCLFAHQGFDLRDAIQRRQ